MLDSLTGCAIYVLHTQLYMILTFCLEDTQFYARIESKASVAKLIRTGVPQGNVLSPISDKHSVYSWHSSQSIFKYDTIRECYEGSFIVAQLPCGRNLQSAADMILLCRLRLEDEDKRLQTYTSWRLHTQKSSVPASEIRSYCVSRFPPRFQAQLT